ncbi:MAG: SIMPL domain-containing protein [Planctomycetales bacterium]
MRFACRWILLSLFCLAARSVAAQSESSNFITGQGSVVLKRVPETLRLQVVLFGRGATLKDALGALKEREGTARKELAALGADPQGIKVEPAEINEGRDDSNQRMMMRMMAMRGGNRGNKAAKKGTPAPPVVVTALLTAEWSLSGKTIEELLLETHPVREKVKAAELSGSKDAGKLTPEQEEMLEEAEQEMMNYGSSDDMKPGEPIFLYVSRVTEKERDQAVSDAFAKARDHAARLARVAGVRLGKLKTIWDNESSNMDSGNYNYNSQYYRMMAMQRAMRAYSDSDESPEAHPLEAVGPQPGNVAFSVTVSTQFALLDKE